MDSISPSNYIYSNNLTIKTWKLVVYRYNVGLFCLRAVSLDFSISKMLKGVINFSNTI